MIFNFLKEKIMKIVFSPFEDPRDPDNDHFEVNGWAATSPEGALDGIRGQLLAAKAMWPDELKGLEVRQPDGSVVQLIVDNKKDGAA